MAKNKASDCQSQMSSSSTQNCGASGESINDSNIENRNKVVRRRDEAPHWVDVARKTWKFGKEIGVAFDGEGDIPVRKIVEMEQSDLMGMCHEQRQDKKG
ncbi:hypothetical protein Ancab_035559, partial [Ancistrocladus abbreviatus]